RGSAAEIGVAHIMIRRATIIAGLVCCLGEIAQAQQADCLAAINTKLPPKVTFDDGSTRQS
ncbi:hypothetical protein, partial [Klebsiella aerogenes]|uniref:hypothetical protein n=1 Tax=Klebsiella aerogenes TaxID=548 RepID=UPI001954D822